MLEHVQTKAFLRSLTLHFFLKADFLIYLGEYKGSAFGGALGHVLKSVACFACQACKERCAYPKACSYGYLFETPPLPEAEKMRKYPAVSPFRPHVSAYLVASQNLT
jgi:hypothetical protein